MADQAQSHRVEGAATEARPYSLLKLDLLLLLVPRQEVRTLESADDLDTVEPPVNGVGWIRVGERRWPVFCFSEQLRQLADVPASRGICAVLAAGEEGFGLMCSDVGMLQLADARVTAMPEAMVLPGRPVRGLALHQGAVMCLSSAARLIAHARAGGGVR